MSGQKPAPWRGFLLSRPRVLRCCNRVLPLFGANRSAMCRVCLCCGHGRENHRHRRTGDRNGSPLRAGPHGLADGLCGSLRGWLETSVDGRAGHPSPAPRGAAERQGGAPDLSPAPVSPVGRHSDPREPLGRGGRFVPGRFALPAPWRHVGSCPNEARWPSGKRGARLVGRSSWTLAARVAACDPPSSPC